MVRKALFLTPCNRQTGKPANRQTKHWLQLKTALLLSLFASFAWSTEERLPLYVPPGIDLMAPPSPVAQRPTVFIKTNKDGANVRQILTRTADDVLVRITKDISDDELSALAKDYAIVNENEVTDLARELADLDIGSQSNSSGACPLPTEFSIVGDSTGEPVGELMFPHSNRPAGAETQWLLFDFYTYKYRLAGSHVPIVLRFKDVVHGWGALIGDNHNSPQGCDDPNSRFNSEIEGWTALPPYPGFDPDTDPWPSPGSTWQSLAFNASCGAEMFDGAVHVGPSYIHVPRYRMLVHAASSHWVAYQIAEWSVSSGWTIITSWTDLDTDLPNPPPDVYDWFSPPPPYDNDADGVMIGATPSNNGTANWAVHFSNVNCGWF